MKKPFGALLFAISCIASIPAAGQNFPPKQPPDPAIDILGSLKVYVQVAVKNDTAEPITFQHSADTDCRTDAPSHFVVAPNGGVSIVDITWDYHDHGFDSCYTRHHYTEYADSKNSRNKFRIQSYASDNRWFCLDIKYNAIFWINEAVCPDVSGSVITAQPRNDNESYGTYCPPGITLGGYCPPSNNGTTMYFSVLMPKGATPAPGLASGPPPSEGYDFLKAGPTKGSCLYNAASVPEPLNAVWHPVIIPELGAAEVTAWIEPCVNLTPSDPYFFWEAEVLAVVRKELTVPVTSYAYSIPYTYSNDIRGTSSTGDKVVVDSPAAISRIVIPLRFDRQQIQSATSVNTANLTIAGVDLSTNHTLPLGGSVLREYYINAWDEYFVTADPLENPAASAPTAWAPTGHSWRVETASGPGLVAVCRFWTGQAFAPKSSHVYTPYADECAKLRTNPNWVFEGFAFQAALPDAAGNCAPGRRPYFRVYNNGMGGAPNHRFTDDVAVRDQMVRDGWSVEGQGPDAVFACLPN